MGFFSLKMSFDTHFEKILGIILIFLKFSHDFYPVCYSCVFDIIGTAIDHL